MFSSNRTYIVGALKHVIVIWRLHDVVADELAYEMTAYEDRIDSMRCSTIDER